MSLDAEVQVGLEFIGTYEEATLEYQLLDDAAAECGVRAVTDYREDIGHSLGSGGADGGTFHWDFVGTAAHITEFLRRAYRSPS